MGRASLRIWDRKYSTCRDPASQPCMIGPNSGILQRRYPSLRVHMSERTCVYFAHADANDAAAGEHDFSIIIPDAEWEKISLNFLNSPVSLFLSLFLLLSFKWSEAKETDGALCLEKGSTSFKHITFFRINRSEKKSPRPLSPQQAAGEWFLQQQRRRRRGRRQRRWRRR